MFVSLCTSVSMRKKATTRVVPTDSFFFFVCLFLCLSVLMSVSICKRKSQSKSQGHYVSLCACVCGCVCLSVSKGAKGRTNRVFRFPYAYVGMMVFVFESISV